MSLLFQKTCEEAGLNKYLFEMANIREHCSWVHMHLPAEATEKAKDLIRMAVAKATKLEPQTENELDIIPSALVIGGGISGITAAIVFGKAGLPSSSGRKRSGTRRYVENTLQAATN